MSSSTGGNTYHSFFIVDIICLLKRGNHIKKHNLLSFYECRNKSKTCNICVSKCVDVCVCSNDKGVCMMCVAIHIITNGCFLFLYHTSLSLKVDIFHV